MPYGKRSSWAAARTTPRAKSAHYQYDDRLLAFLMCLSTVR
jgi:hypothetical protein